MSHDSSQEPLAPGEEILWTGQPYGGFYLDPRAIFPAVFGAFFLLFLATMATIMFTRPKPIPIEGIVFFFLWFLGVGTISLYLIVGRFWLDARRRRRIRYTLTSQRIIIRSGLVVPKKTVTISRRSTTFRVNPLRTGEAMFFWHPEVRLSPCGFIQE
jgi:hypothetical protein